MSNGAPQRRVIEGRCACGAITVSARVEAVALARCHCSQCRKACGSDFLGVFPVAENDVALSDPRQSLRSWWSSADKQRCFCSNCGAPIYSRRTGSATLRVRAGLFDTLGAVTHTGHIFWASRAAWDGTADRLPRHDTLEPGRR